MLRPYIVNSINAAILIVAGLLLYFTEQEKTLVALAAPGLGLMLLACTHHIRKHNWFVTHTVTAITLLATIVIVMELNTLAGAWSTSHMLLLLIGISCLVAVGVFIGSFIQERRLRNNRIYKDDL